MSISDRLELVDQRREASNWSLTARHMLIGRDVPDILAALRSVLDVCGEVEDQHHPDRMYEGGMEEVAHRVLVAIHKTLGETP